MATQGDDIKALNLRVEGISEKLSDLTTKVETLATAMHSAIGIGKWVATVATALLTTLVVSAIGGFIWVGSIGSDVRHIDERTKETNATIKSMQEQQNKATPEKGASGDKTLDKQMGVIRDQLAVLNVLPQRLKELDSRLSEIATLRMTPRPRRWVLIQVESIVKDSIKSGSDSRIIDCNATFTWIPKEPFKVDGAFHEAALVEPPLFTLLSDPAGVTALEGIFVRTTGNSKDDTIRFSFSSETVSEQFREGLVKLADKAQAMPRIAIMKLVVAQ